MRVNNLDQIQEILRSAEMRGERQVAWIRLVLGILTGGMVATMWGINTLFANLVFIGQSSVLILYSFALLAYFRAHRDEYMGWLKYVSIFVDLATFHAAIFAAEANHAGAIEYYQSFFPLALVLFNVMSGLRYSVPACMYSALVTVILGSGVLAYVVVGHLIPVSPVSVYGKNEINIGDELMRIAFLTLPALLAGVIAFVSKGLLVRAEQESMQRAEVERQRERLAKYLSPDLAELVTADEAGFRLGGSRRHATILFSDIRNFTPLAESTEPEEIVKLLNEYFTEMVAIVFRYGGTLDKFLGDGLMAVFGVPFDLEQQELRAVVVALEMISAVEALNARIGTEEGGRPPLNIGVGIATGPVVAGNIGSLERMEFTCIGDTVNFAARLESLNRSVDTSIIVSEPTFNALGDAIPARRLPPIPVKGKAGMPNLYAIDPRDVPEADLRRLGSSLAETTARARSSLAATKAKKSGP